MDIVIWTHFLSDFERCKTNSFRCFSKADCYNRSFLFQLLLFSARVSAEKKCTVLPFGLIGFVGSFCDAAKSLLRTKVSGKLYNGFSTSKRFWLYAYL